jgi:tellurite resistance protein
MACAYLVKAVTSPAIAWAEFHHPIAGNLFGTIFISLLLLPIVLAPWSLAFARIVWMLGAVGMVVFAWVIVSRWMSDRQLIAHATPAWIVPVVGLLDMPLALPSLAFSQMHGVMVLGLAVGLFFAIPLFTLIFSRLVFEAPMPPPLQPTLMILIAPFSVGFSAYVVTTGQVDLFAESLFALTLFMLAVLVGRLRQAAICCPFRVSWWAISFPLATCAIAALRFASAEPGRLADIVAIALLAFATLAIVVLFARTAFGIARGELRTLSGP